MNLLDKQEDKQDFSQQFSTEEMAQQPLDKVNQSQLTFKNQETDDIKAFGQKIFSNLLVIVGGFFLYISTGLLFRHFVILSENSRLSVWKQLLFLFGGLLVMYLQPDKIKTKGDLSFYSLIPVMSIIFCLLFSLIPGHLLFLDAFGYMFMLFYVPVFLFSYFVKKQIDSSIVP